MRSDSRKLLLGAMFGAAGLLMTAPASALLIDNFDSGPGGVSDAAPGPLTIASGDAIGGSRTLEILSTVGPLGNALDVIAPPGVLSHSQDSLTAGSSKVTWDMGGAGLGGVDLTDGGLSTGLKIDLLSIDVGMIDITVMIMDTGGGMSDFLLPGLVIGENEFLFSDFVGLADFTDVDVIMMKIDADIASDLTLDLLETVGGTSTGGIVPEPITATLGLLGLGVLGAATRRRTA